MQRTEIRNRMELKMADWMVVVMTCAVTKPTTTSREIYSFHFISQKDSSKSNSSCVYFIFSFIWFHRTIFRLNTFRWQFIRVRETTGSVLQVISICATNNSCIEKWAAIEKCKCKKKNQNVKNFRFEWIGCTSLSSPASSSSSSFLSGKCVREWRWQNVNFIHSWMCLSTMWL